MDSDERSAAQGEVGGGSSLGWYRFLKERMQFPFVARGQEWRVGSPLQRGDEVEVIGLADPEECRAEIRVDVRWDGKVLPVPLSQLNPDGADDATRKAIADWYYWHGLGAI